MLPFITYIIIDSRLRSHRSFIEEKKNGIYKRHKVRKNSYFDPFTYLGRTLTLTHLLFVDDVLLFCDGLRRDDSKLKEILNLYCTTTYMMVDMQKYSFSFNDMAKDQIKSIQHLFLYQLMDFQLGFKYLGFYIKPNDSEISDWKWIIAKVERRINFWCNMWLSSGGRLILVKSMLDAIPIYWHSLAFIPKKKLASDFCGTRKRRVREFL